MMNANKCNSCGAELDANTTFCKNCGANAPSIQAGVSNPVSGDMAQQPILAQQEAAAPFNTPQFQDLQNQPYAQAPAPAPYAQVPAPYAQAPAPYGQAPAPYGQAPPFPSPYTPQPYGQPGGYGFPIEKKISVLCLVSFIASILAWVFISFSGMFFVGITLAFVTGIIGVKRFNENTEKFKWMGITGIIISSIAIALLVIGIVAVIIVGPSLLA